jgi:hypothetical protein
VSTTENFLRYGSPSCIRKTMSKILSCGRISYIINALKFEYLCPDNPLIVQTVLLQDTILYFNFQHWNFRAQFLRIDICMTICNLSWGIGIEYSHFDRYRFCSKQINNVVHDFPDDSLILSSRQTWQEFINEIGWKHLDCWTPLYKQKMETWVSDYRNSSFVFIV